MGGMWTASDIRKALSPAPYRGPGEGRRIVEGRGLLPTSKPPPTLPAGVSPLSTKRSYGSAKSVRRS